MFNCARCREQVRLCRSCDRGNRYCGRECALLNRRQGQAEAGRRYQRTFKGALKHSHRQAEYKRRCKEEVTHQCSPEACQDDIVCPETEEVVSTEITKFEPAEDAVLIRCSGCGRLCGPFARQDFIGRCRLGRTTGGNSGRFKRSRIRDPALVLRREVEKRHHRQAATDSSRCS